MLWFTDCVNTGELLISREPQFVPLYNWLRASLVAQMVKNSPAMRETWVQSLGWEDLLEKGMANPLQYSCPENPMDRGAW